MKPHPPVVGLGLGMLDLRVQCSDFPVAERDDRVRDIEIGLGGTTAAVLAALARYGWPTALVGAVGSDRLADIVRDGLAAAGVDITGLRAAPGTTPTCLVLDIPPTRTLLWHVSAEVEAALDDLDASFVDGFGVLHVNGRFPAAAKRACRRARETGVLVSLNAGRGDVGAGAEVLLPYADVAVASDEWALRYTGARTAREACLALLDNGPTAVSVTCGSDGSVTAGRGTEAVYVPAAPVPTLHTTRGAGDAYHAGFLRAHLLGLPPVDCARQATNAAAEHCARGRATCSS